jgi:hypothetical protein
MKTIITTAAMCIFAHILFAQEPVIKRIWGVIADKDSKINIADVEVQIVNMPQTTRSNEKGQFHTFY